jgi:UDP-N-acetylmuramate dehydrogenase
MSINIQEKICLANYTTFRIGGVADYFVSVNTDSELVEALNFAHDQKLKVFILGGGSNILVDDDGFRGLVIHISINHLEILKEDVKDIEIKVSAGYIWDDLVLYSVDHDWYGLENLSGIPGTVGAAPVQNIGAYGVEVKNLIYRVEALNIDTLEIRQFENDECDFSYRDSFFKTDSGKKYIITSVIFKLSKSMVMNLEYKDIKTYFEVKKIINPTLKDVRCAILDIRSNKLPDIRKLGTAGSFFKNPIILRTKYNELLTKYPSMPSYSVDEQGESTNSDESFFVKIPLAWILDNVCNFKGYRDGDVGVYKNQALVIVNFGHATAFEIKALAQNITESVFEKTNIEIEPEVQYI